MEGCELQVIGCIIVSPCYRMVEVRREAQPAPAKVEEKATDQINVTMSSFEYASRVDVDTCCIYLHGACIVALNATT